MSTFLGEISEIPGISVDRFNGEKNLESTAYFLSHCHTDHMEGLGECFFQNLIRRDKYLYCSPISKAFLLGIYPGIPEDRIISIEHTIPKTVEYEITNNSNTVKTCLTVTTSPAGHCPGSVMFVFNKDDKTILYTGDFRINPRDLSKLNPLNNKVNGKNVAKKFDSIYLDTTFLSMDYQNFPSRKESCLEICKAIRNWLELDSKNIVVLECSAYYGTENLFMEISKLLKTKIHVKDVVYSNYTRIEELSECSTNDGTSSRIHACASKSARHKISCRSDVKFENILTIVPSVMRWKSRMNLDKYFTEYDSSDKQRLYICQSMHASYEELKTFVDYFKPDKIIPCVCPSESINKIYELIHQLQYYKRNESKKVDKDSHNFKLRVPEVRSVCKKVFKSKYFNDDEEE